MRIHSRNQKDRLKDRVEGRGLEREMTLMRVKERMERDRAISDAKDMVPNLEFWCRTCKRDFVGFGFKQVRVMPLKDRTRIAFYYGHCPQLHRCIRRITDKLADPYYRESFIVLRQAIDFADDLMTPNDPRFALRYPKEYERFVTDNGENPEGRLELI